MPPTGGVPALTSRRSKLAREPPKLGTFAMLPALYFAFGHASPPVLADQRRSPAAAEAKLAATTPAPKAAKPATESPSEPMKPAKATPRAKASRTLHLLGKASPYRPGTALAKMLALVQDGMTTTQLAAAFKAAGLNTSVSGFVRQRRGRARCCQSASRPGHLWSIFG